MANLWLSSDADKTITVGETITLTAYCDPSTVSSGISSYKAKVLLDDYRTSGSAVSWSTTSSGNWKATCRYTFDEPGTYDVCVCICNSSGDSLAQYTGWITVYVEEEAFEPPTISIRAFTSTSSGVTMNAEVDCPSPGRYYVEFEISYLGISQTHTSSRFTSSTGLTWPFYDIPSNTTVTGYVYLYDYDTDELYDYARATVTTLPPPRPDDWYWTSTVAKGAEIPFTRSGNVITCKPLTASEWNDFIDRIFEFLDYTEHTVTGDPSGFYVTAGTAMSADTVELARRLIEVMNPPTALPSAISSGGKITAAYINGLKNSLNSIE